MEEQNYCTIDDVAKVELKVGTVTAAEPVEGSEKLLRLELDLGNEQRQILAGIAKSYQPTELIGRQLIIVANLKPRTMMGLESQGMVLCASDETQLAVLTPEKAVQPGSTIR